MNSRHNFFRHRHVVLLGAVAAATILFAGCGKKADTDPLVTGNQASAYVTAAALPRDAEAENAVSQANQKLNTYTAGYNKLIGTFGITETRKDYFNENIAKRSSADSLSVSDGWVEGALDELKKGRGLHANGLTALDASADALIGPLDKLVTQLKGLHVYYESKAYKDDKLARGKAEDAPVRANFDASITAMTAFNAALDVEQKKSNVELLARLKASGNMLAYDTKLALGQGEELVNLFGDADFKTAAKYAKGDTLVKELETTLASQRELYAAAKAKGPVPDYGHESTANNLVSLVGAYRATKESRQHNDYNDMVKAYNEAVGSANGIH